MSKKLKELDIKRSYILLFKWYDQYKKWYDQYKKSW